MEADKKGWKKELMDILIEFGLVTLFIFGYISIFYKWWL